MQTAITLANPMRRRHAIEGVRQWARFCAGLDDVDAANDRTVLDVLAAVDDFRAIYPASDATQPDDSCLPSREEWLRYAFDAEGTPRWPMDRVPAIPT